MKKCINCGEISEDEAVKVYGSKSVVYTDEKGIHEGYIINKEPEAECCPECGGAVE